MNVKTLLKAIVPDNIQNIPVVQKCLDVFTELLSNNARIADRIRNLFSVDPEIRRTVDDSGFVQVHEDSDYVKQCKAELKEGLFCTYLSVLWDAVKDTQYSSEVQKAIRQRGYFDNKLEQEIAEILDCEDMTVFSTRRRYLCAESFMRYMYRFGKYLESGEMEDDLETNHWQKFSFSVRYAGSLYCAFFNSFSKPTAHPAGWDLEYDTTLKLAFSDVFGVVFEYVLPRIVIRTHDEIKIILFTQKSRAEILEDLLKENNILRKEPFDYDYITAFASYPWIETDELTEEMLNSDYSVNNQIIKLIIVKKEYQKAEIEKDPFLQKICFSDNSYIIKDKTGVRYKPSGKTAEFSFGIRFKLDIGSAEDLIITADPEKTTLNFLYTDEMYFENILDMSWKDGAFRLNPCPDNAFKVSGNAYKFVTGLDESKHVPSNVPDMRRILRITAKPEGFAYYSVFDDFGHINVKTLIPEIQMHIFKEYSFDLDCSGLRGNYITFRCETSDYSYMFRFNLSKGFPTQICYDQDAKKVMINGTTATKKCLKKVYNQNTQKYTEKTANFENMDFSVVGIYGNVPGIPKTEKLTDLSFGRTLSEMNSRLFGEITFSRGVLTFPEAELPDQMSVYSSDPENEPKDLTCLCYIGKGFEKEITDNDCCIRIDSEKYAKDEFSISNKGSTGKILMTDDGYLVTRDVKTAQRLNSGLGFVLTAG